MNTTPQQIPLSVGQEAIWVAWKLDPEHWIHIIPTPFLVRGTLDITRLRRAVSALGRAYPQLRGRVVPGRDGSVLDWSDARDIPVRESVTALERDEAVRQTWQVPFDLRQGPLARVDLLRGPDYTVLVISAHHLVYDGASILVLAGALRRAYAGETLPQADHVPALKAFADRSWELADTVAGDAQRAHWRRALGSGSPDFTLPSTVDEPQYTVLSEDLPADLAARLRDRAAEFGVSYVTVLLGAYYALLRRYSGATDVLVFVPFHGRTPEALQDRIGYFVNALPIRSEVRDSDTYADLLLRLRTHVKDGMRHGDLPLPAIMRTAGLTGPAAHARTHQTVFQFWHAGLRDGVDVQNLRLQGPGSSATLSLLDMESGAGFTLAVMVREDSAGTHVLWKDPTGAVGPTVISAMAASYREVLRAIAADPTAALIAVVAQRDGQVPSAESGVIEPGTADPRAVAEMVEVWQGILGIGGIGPQDSFFELGGHSLLAERLVLAVSDRFGGEVSIRTLFEFPRLSDFVGQVLGSASGSAGGEESVGVELPAQVAAPAVVDTTEAFPASSFQRRIWLAERVESGQAAYNVPLAWRVAGGLDAGALQQALAKMVARHEILRTEFHERDGELWQVVVQPWVPEVVRVDLRDQADPEHSLRQWLHRASHHEFTLASGRLLTAALIELGEAGQVLFLCLHHLLWDGESMGILVKELDSCYSGMNTEVSVTVPVTQTSVTRPMPSAAGSGRPDVIRTASAHQGRMWFVERFEAGHVYPTSPTYHNLPLYVRMDRLPTEDALAEALGQVVRAHEALRTNLDSVGGRIVQRVRSDVSVSPQWLAPPSPPAGSAVPRVLTNWAAKPFDLAGEPLLRVAVLPQRTGGGWLALAGHQAVVDSWSLRLVAGQLLAAVAGRAPEPSSFPDWLDGVPDEAKQKDLAARAATLQPLADPVRLPERRQRDAVHVYEEQSVHFTLPDELPIGPAARRLGLSVPDVLLGAFAALLGWYTGQQEMVVGVGHPGRRAASRHVVGPLANMLPVRLRPEVHAAFATLAAETAAELADARAHDQAPFDELVRLVNPAKDMSRTALFDVLFSYPDQAEAISTPDGAVAEQVETAGGYGKYDLHLLVQQKSGRHEGHLVFNGRYFDHDQMQAMAEHYVVLLGQLVTAPERAIGEAHPLTESERYTQLTVWNAAQAGYPESPVHDIVRQRALARPQAVALTAGEAELTYRELLEGAEAAARGLLAQGIRAGELVALVLPRGAGQVQAILAVLLAGAAYLPIDPALPAERIEFILADSGARWVVVPDDTAPHPGLEGFTGRVLRGNQLDTAAADIALPRVPLDSPAYCIYTSGTTGRPKGVVITHRNLIRLLQNERFPFSFGPSDVWTMFHAYNFDFSVWELFGGLAHGGRVVVVSEEQAKDPWLFWELVQRERVTVLNQTPSAFRRLLSLEPQSPTSLNQLRYVIFGGEALRPAMLAPWLEQHPHVRLVNMYGITETTVHASIRTVTRADVDADASVIGSPIPTTTLLLLDPCTGGRLLPVGAVGEIFVGGAGVAGGYLNRPELSAERFVDSPVGSGTLFRSGDLARYNPDGTLQFIGRADSQVQLRGYRIELGEIRSCLCEHPAVTDAVVVAEDDRLVAVVQSQAQLTSGHLRGHVARKLPEYMIPSAFHVVDRMVLTSNGKLDIDALRAMAVPLSSIDGPEPRTPTAGTIAAVWSELLGVPAVAADDSFFALGGHSMLAVRLVNELSRRFQLELPMKTLFEFPRLQDLADLVDRKLAGRLPGHPAGPSGSPVDGAPAATDFQQRVWLAEQVDDRVRNNVFLAWKADGRLDLELLSRALIQLVEGHEILRTAFAAEAGMLRQVVNEPWEPQIELLDLRDSHDHDAELMQWLSEAAGRPFDLGSGRLLRAAIADLGAQGHVLLLCIHHLVIDGESVPVLLSELERYYRATREGDRPAPPALQHRDFVAAQAALRDSAQRRADLTFWQEKLAGAPAYVDFPAPERPGPNGAVRVPLPADLLDRLRPLQDDHGVTWFMVFAAALSVALHRWTGRGSLTLGVPVTTRGQGGFADVLGPCLNTVVLRSELGADTTVLEVLHAMRSEVLGAFEHAGAPFDDVLTRLDPVRVPGRTPYVDAVLNMNLRSNRRAVLGDVELTAFFAESLWSHEAKFGLTLTVAEQDGELTAMLSYQGDRVAATDARALADSLAGLLAGLADARQGPLPDVVASVTPAERLQYRSFVAAQAALRDSAQRRADLTFWQEKLAGAPAYVDFPAPERPGPNGAVRVSLPADLLDRLRPLQAQYGVSPYMVAATCLALLLHHWTRQNDVVISSAMTNRDSPDFADVLGPCLNTVVLRSELGAGATVLDVLQAMRSEVLGAFEHVGAPFEDVVDRLNPPRRSGRTPYADVTLAFGAAPSEQATLGGRPLLAVDISREDTGYIGKLGLTVALNLDGAELSGRITYRGDRYRREDVERFAALFGRLLGLVPDSLARPVSVLDIAPEETARPRQWERGPEPEPVIPVPALVLQRGLDGPDAPAIESDRGTLTYQQLVGRARALATRVRPHLRGADPVVALLLDRGEDFTVAMLATWLAGAAFCPIDPAWPRARVEYVLADVRASVLLTDHGGTVGTQPAPILRLDEIGEAVETSGDADWAPGATAYVIYTSGTTGSPKGVVVTHGGLAQLIQWTVRTYGFGPGDRCSHLLSVGFDASQWEVWYTLASGACLVPHEAPVVASTLGRWLDRQRVTMSFLATPLAEAVWSAGDAPRQLRWMFIGGAALSEWPPSELPYRVCNAYGPTENSVVTSTHDLNAEAVTPLNRIGKPIAGVRVHVLDPEGRRCPVGVTGEIHLAGGGLATGYLRRPELTADKFRLVELDGESVRVYHSGDLGRWLPDGTIEYLGRADRQLKIRGHRIEPGEIERLLMEQPEVAQTVVHGDPHRVPALVAYVTPRGPGRIDPAQLLLKLRSSLPAFMVPEAVVWLDELPIGTNGKIDESRLPLPVRVDLASDESFTPPGSELERRIAAVWSQVLTTSSVGVHDNFFDLGGNSLTLAKLHSRLVVELGRDIPITELFEHPTVAGLAAAVQTGGRQLRPDEPASARPKRAVRQVRRGRGRTGTAEGALK